MEIPLDFINQDKVNTLPPSIRKGKAEVQSDSSRVFPEKK